MKSDIMLDQPRPCDFVIFPAGHRRKVHSLSNDMVWFANPDGSRDEKTCIPILDFLPTSEPDVWCYAGDTIAAK